MFNDPRAADTELLADIGNGEELSQTIHTSALDSKENGSAGPHALGANRTILPDGRRGGAERMDS